MRSKITVTFLLVLLSAALAFAQSSGAASISGVVRDASGAVVPNARVVVANAAQGAARTIATNEAGVFTAPALTPGPGYRVTVTASGFAGYDVRDISLLVGQNLDLKVSLTVATATTAVEVTAAAPLVENTKSDVSGVVDQRSIQELPINGRRVDSFVLLTPAVNNDGNYGLLSFRGVAGQNSFLVDGADTTQQYYNENAGRTRIASQISQDAVQEFQVVSSNYTAEYGRAMGGIVNTVTKSGTNDLHGGGYWFYRSTGFNARDPFSAYVPSEKRQQRGASLGGAIKKDKLFYFLNTENTTAVDGATQSWKLCGVASGSGATAVPAATPAQCAAINTLLPRFYGQIPRQLNQELYFGKLDYRLNEKHMFSASFNFLHALSPAGIQTAASSTSGSAITGNGDDAVTVRNGRAVWTYVPTSNFVNESRLGFASDRQADTFSNGLLGGGLGYLQVSVNGTSLGQANYLPRIQPSERRFQFQDSATWTLGNHTLKAGVDIANTRDYVYYISNFYGSYTYQTVNAFALDFSGNSGGAKRWQTYTQTFGNPVVDYRINDVGVYLQDQWRATSRLTLNYGLRFEDPRLPQPPACNQDYPLTCSLPTSNSSFAPRLGLAYRLNDKTVLQAGYGMYYARFQGGTIQNLFTTGNGKVQTSMSLSATQAAQVAVGPVFPYTLPSLPSGGSVSATSIQMLAPDLKTPYSQQGNLGIQRQLTTDMALNVSWVWSRGLQLYGVRDLNLPTATTNFTYTIADASGATAGFYATPVYMGKRPDTRYGTVAYVENGVNSYYNALAVQFNKRFRRGVQAMASYTWAHEIDDGQSYGQSANNLWLNSPNYWLYNGNYKADKGSGTLDQRHRFALSWVWAPTFTHRSEAFFRYVVNNWQISSVTTMQAGRPAGSMQVYVTDTPVTGMFANSSLNGSGFSYRVPWLPVNSYYYPPSYKSDARISKIIPLAESRRLYLNFEIFNLANTWNASSYTSSRAFSESKGVITPTPQNLYVPSAAYGSPDGTQARRMQVSARLVF